MTRPTHAPQPATTTDTASTRHWIEARIDHDTVATSLICEHPTACTATAERDTSCAVTEWFDNTGPELLTFPPDRQDVFGRIEVVVHWTGGDVDADLTLSPAPPRPTVSAIKLGQFIRQANTGGMAEPWRALKDYLRSCGIDVTR